MADMSPIFRNRGPGPSSTDAYQSLEEDTLEGGDYKDAPSRFLPKIAQDYGTVNATPVRPRVTNQQPKKYQL